jgi:DNA-binding LacI/PurR family transcriptional regulator
MRQRIATGVWTPGLRLPAERQLANAFHCSRAAIRQALDEMVSSGLVRLISPRIRVVAGGRGSDALAGTVIVVSPIGDPGASANPFLDPMRAMTDGVVEGLRQAGLETLLLPGSTAGRNKRARLAAQGPAGWVLLGISSPDVGRVGTLLAEMRRMSPAPIVVYEDLLPDPSEGESVADLVVSDHHGGACALVDMAVARGRRNMLIVDQDCDHAAATIRWRRQRHAGYAAACVAAGLRPPRRVDLPGVNSYRDGLDGFVVRATAAFGFLQPFFTGPDAVDALFAISDGMLPVIAEVAIRCGRRPGVDLDLFGYDNNLPLVWETAFRPVVPVATVDKDFAALGRELARMLLDRRAGRLPAGTQRTVVPVHVIAGG